MEKELQEWHELHKFYKYSAYLTKDLASYLKVTPRAIQMWIKGQRQPRKKRMKQIRKYLTERDDLVKRASF